MTPESRQRIAVPQSFCIVGDDRWSNDHHGIGRFSTELFERLPALKPLGLVGSPTAPMDVLKLTGRLWRQKPDVFFSPGYNCPLRASCPTVITVHDLAHIQLADMSPAKKLYYQLVLRPALRRAYAVLTVSNYFKDEIARWANLPLEKIAVVGSGVSSAFSREGAAHVEVDPYFLHVGNQRPHKNLMRVLSAFSDPSLNRKFKLLCTGIATDEYKSRLDELGLTRRVVFLGRISSEKLAEIYRGALGLVFASLYEGFGLPIVEAMTSGTPVITSNVTSMPEIAADAALLVTPTDVAEIRAAMHRLADDNALRADLISRGFHRVQQFTWQSTAEKVGSVLTSAAERRSHLLGLGAS